MRWWHGAFTSSSSSAKPQQQHSYDDSVIRYNSVKPSFFSSSRRDRQFHRGRRLRRLFRSPSHYENSSATSPSPSHSSVSPQPLPLPELHVLLRRDPNFVKSSSPSVPLPSPGDAVQTRGGAEEKERDRIEKASNAEAVDGWVKRLTGEERRRNVERSESRSSSRKSPRKKNAKERSQRSYNINIPISAPTSPYSSPILSPPRSDMLATQSSTPPGVFQVWSAPEMPHSDRNIGFGFYYQSPYDRNESSLDNSPLHSPRGSNNMFAASPPRPASPVNARIPLENPLARWESNAQATVHPLPLPPGAVGFLQPGPISPVSDFSGGSVPSQRSSVSTPPPISPVSDFSGASVPSQFPQMSSRDVCEFPGANIPSQSAPISQNASKPEVMPIKSQWQKGKLIGRGTFGSVYVASNRETGALCAMKEVEILPDDSKSAECMRQLEQEIKVLSRLKHPNIVQYYGSEIVGDRFYIYLEYVHPGSINKFIQDHCGAITESVVRNFTRHILSGLAYLHRKKTIHRDIKGANLLVDAYGVVKLADFGMAKHLNGQAANLSLKGSPYWLAPELLQSVMQKDASSDVALAVDIWSLGCTIIEMMNGKPPWSEYEGAAALFKVLQESPPIPETLSAEGKDFLECCFRRNPADRPTASKLLDHPFLNYSQHVDSCAESLNEMQLSGNKQSRRQGRNHKLEQIPSSFDTKSKKGNRGNNEISQQNLGQAPRLTVAPIPSPRSTLEVLPTLSPPSSGMDII